MTRVTGEGVWERGKVEQMRPVPVTIGRLVGRYFDTPVDVREEEWVGVPGCDQDGRVERIKPQVHRRNKDVNWCDRS